MGDFKCPVDRRYHAACECATTVATKHNREPREIKEDVPNEESSPVVFCAGGLGLEPRETRKRTVRVEYALEPFGCRRNGPNSVYADGLERPFIELATALGRQSTLRFANAASVARVRPSFVCQPPCLATRPFLEV